MGKFSELFIVLEKILFGNVEGEVPTARRWVSVPINGGRFTA